MPEPGTPAVIASRGDAHETEVQYYWTGLPEQRIRDYRAGVGHYRELAHGEFELMSFGMAQVFGSRRGMLWLRGGICTGWFSNDDLEIGFKAATHRRVLHDHTTGEINQEERYGVVWRTDPDDVSKRTYPRVRGAFAHEHLRRGSARSTPGNLYYHREGHVIDDEGEQEESPIGTKLRVYNQWIDTVGDILSVMVDENSNTWVTLTGKATTGVTVKVPKGTFRVEAGDKIQFGARENIEFTGNHATFKARGVLKIEGKQSVVISSSGAIAMDAPNIQLNGRVVMPGSMPI